APPRPLIRPSIGKATRFVAEVGERPEAPASDRAPPADKPSIAVLPFQNLSGDPEQAYFVDGMLDDITAAIARVTWLFVIARNSSLTSKSRAADVKQVAREL